MAKKTAGQPWHGIGSEKTKSPLKTSVEIADMQKAAATTDWKFPSTLTEATAILKSVRETTVNSETEWEALQPKLTALKMHVFKLQQGLPVTETKSTDFDHRHMMGVMRDMQLKQLVRTNPLIKDLVDEVDKLRKAKSPEDLTIKIAALETDKAALAEKLKIMEAEILELTKTNE